MTTFVLVPGAWLGAWVWTEVSDRLAAAGHTVVPVTLPGLAERAGEEPPATINLTRHADDVIDRLAADDLWEVTLVVHSYGCTVGGLVTDRAPERLAHVVHVGGSPLPDGTSMFDLYGPEGEAMVRQLAEAAGDRDLIPLTDDVLEGFYPRHGMADGVRADFMTRRTGQPLATFAERFHPTGAGDRVARSLIWCTGDGEAPFGAGTPGWTYREIPTGHWPMLTHPELLVDTLLALPRPTVDAGRGARPAGGQA